MDFPEIAELRRQVEELKYRNERLTLLLNSTVALCEQRMRRIFDLEDAVDALSKPPDFSRSCIDYDPNYVPKK